jgi:hypothetical protein
MHTKCVCLQNQDIKPKSGKKALGSSAHSRTVSEVLVKAPPARSLVTGVFSFLRQTGFDKVALGAFLVFQAAPSDVSSWMFGDSVMLGDVYYRCEPLVGSDPRPFMHYLLVPFMHYLSACSIDPLSPSCMLSCTNVL